jgi:hypothetical protein
MSGHFLPTVFANRHQIPPFAMADLPAPTGILAPTRTPPFGCISTSSCGVPYPSTWSWTSSGEGPAPRHHCRCREGCRHGFGRCSTILGLGGCSRWCWALELRRKGALTLVSTRRVGGHQNNGDFSSLPVRSRKSTVRRGQASSAP